MSAIQQILASFGTSAGGGVTYTPVFCCGFECQRLGSVGEHWTSSPSASISTSTVRSGSASLRINPTAASALVTCVQAAATVYVIRFYIRFTTLPSVDVYLAWCGTGTSRIGVAFKQSDSKIYCAQGTTPTMAASGVSVTTGTWYRIDLKIDQTSGARTADAKVDGASVTQATSAGTGGATAISLGNTPTANADYFIDDFLLSQTAADYPLGAGYVNHFIPVSDGSHNTGAAGNFKRGEAGTNITDATTDSYLLVDEVPLDDTTPDALDYISAEATAATNYTENVFGAASGISTPVTAPRAVEVVVAHHQSGTAVGNSTFKLNDNGTEGTIVALNAAGVTSIRYARNHFASAPTGGAWTLSGAGNFNNLKIRFGYSSDASPHQYFDCAMVEAEFQ